MKNIIIDNKKIGKNGSVFVIAELSANHNQDFEIAVKTIEGAKDAGADAIKFQTYTADTITINCNNKYFKINQGTLWDGTTLYDLYKEAYMPWDWQPKLKKIANKLGLACFSSPFDNSAVDFLEKIDMPAYKIASFEITDIPLISYVAKKKKPVIISTGIATSKEIREAVDACRKVNNQQIILLKCTSSYPAKIQDSNLLMIQDLSSRFDVISGLSDHTMGIITPIPAVALGAKVIEKHLILDKNLGGPDSEFSLDINEFKKMVNLIRETESSLGEVNYSINRQIRKNRKFSRSIFVIEDINKGEFFTNRNIRSIRPGDGISPKYLPTIIGKKSKKNIKRGTPLKLEDF